jgi:hypothetical protein
MPTKNKRPVSPLEAWRSEELGLSRSEFAALIYRHSEGGGYRWTRGDFARRVAALESGMGDQFDEDAVFGSIRKMTSEDFARDLLQRQQAFAAERAKARDDAVKARGAD